MATDIPGASVYGSAVELAKKRYQTRLADLNKQRQTTMRQAGFAGDINAETGLISNQRVDPYNPYGQYQQLNRAQSQRYDEMVGQNIGRGLGSRGGLGAQNLSNLRYDFGKEDANFGTTLSDMLATFTRQQEDERFSYDEALWQAQQAAAQSAMAAGDFGAPGHDGEGAGDDRSGDGNELPRQPDGSILFAPVNRIPVVPFFPAAPTNLPTVKKRPTVANTPTVTANRLRAGRM